MELKIDEEIFKAYGFTSTTIKLQQIGSGHINRTYLLSTLGAEKFILQSVNIAVFKDPQVIANNIKAVADELNLLNPSYLFPAPIATVSGDLMSCHNGEFWRLLPYIPNAIAFDTLTDPKQAYEAAKQFGKLSALLHHFDISRLKPTIVGFHDLELRYQQFTKTLDEVDLELKTYAKHEIELALQHYFIVDQYQSVKNNLAFPNRVMHHDTKISNVLLDEVNYEGVCVIDLDTLMPGKFISDLGDMMRTYLCGFSENEKNLDLIKIRIPYFKATIDGYLSEMASILTTTEKKFILFAGKYIIYMQAVRFLTDYLKGSPYYPISYAEQNLDRARNQFKLLSELFENEKILQDSIDQCLRTS